MTLFHRPKWHFAAKKQEVIRQYAHGSFPGLYLGGLNDVSFRVKNRWTLMKTFSVIIWSLWGLCFFILLQWVCMWTACLCVSCKSPNLCAVFQGAHCCKNTCIHYIPKLHTLPCVITLQLVPKMSICSVASSDLLDWKQGRNQICRVSKLCRCELLIMCQVCRDTCTCKWCFFAQLQWNLVASICDWMRQTGCDRRSCMACSLM